jgi:ABC-2 type transport system ATP-binding protein
MLEIKNVNKKYGSVAALKNISFSIKENEICGFIGDNGAGKTTTIKSIFGETSIQSGEILFKGKNIFDEYVLQDLFFFPDSNNIPLDLTIDEYLNYTLLLRGFDKKEIANTKEKVYKLLELEKHHKKKLRHLSAGLKKRAIMACCLSMKAKLIILDEPTANLDIETKNDFIKILQYVNQSGVTIMITSHLIDELQPLINKLVIIKEGEIVYENKFDNGREKIIDIYNNKVNRNKVDLKIINEIYK